MLPFAITLFFGLTAIPELAIEVYPGGGPPLQSGDRYTVTYRVGILGGKELANSDLRGLPFSKELGDGHDGYFDRWVQGMSVGGMREILIDSEHIPVVLRNSLPAKTDVTVTLRLVAFKKKHPR
jgi:hypothetical protein